MGKGKTLPRPETCFGILAQRTNLFVSHDNKTLETHYFAIPDSLKQCVKLVLRNNDSVFFSCAIVCACGACATVLSTAWVRAQVRRGSRTHPYMTMISSLISSYSYRVLLHGHHTVSYIVKEIMVDAVGYAEVRNP